MSEALLIYDNTDLPCYHSETNSYNPECYWKDKGLYEGQEAMCMVCGWKLEGASCDDESNR